MLLSLTTSRARRAYDLLGRGYLTRSQMAAALSELGVMHGLGEKGLNQVLGQDPATSREARYNIQDFLSMYERMGLYQVGAPLQGPAGCGRVRGGAGGCMDPIPWTQFAVPTALAALPAHAASSPYCQRAKQVVAQALRSPCRRRWHGGSASARCLPSAPPPWGQSTT
jgi:hypothetical protein